MFACDSTSGAAAFASQGGRPRSAAAEGTCWRLTAAGHSCRLTTSAPAVHDGDDDDDAHCPHHHHRHHHRHHDNHVPRREGLSRRVGKENKCARINEEERATPASHTPLFGPPRPSRLKGGGAGASRDDGSHVAHTRRATTKGLSVGPSAAIKADPIECSPFTPFITSQDGGEEDDGQGAGAAEAKDIAERD